MAKQWPIIALIDMDCFFVQVEQRGKPELDGKPCAVTQYNLYKGGGIIASNYEARAFGVQKGMWGDDALAKCKDLTLFHTPQRRGKADSSKYREASFEVFDVLSNYDSDIIIEKASIDEAYIDLTNYLNKHPDLELPTKEEMTDCFAEGVKKDYEKERDFDIFYDMITAKPESYEDEIRLLKGARIVSFLRRAILEKTQFYCSAGISHSKVLAKLAAGIHKPKSQTILSNYGKKQVLARTEIGKLRSLGGKFGHQIVERLNIQYVDQINNFTIEQLRALFDEKTADYLTNLANGIDEEKVIARKLSKSIGCGKNFAQAGTNCLNNKNQVEYWIDQLCDELLERLDRDKEMNNRRPTLLVLSIDQVNIGMLSRSTQFEYFGKERLVEILMNKIINPILFRKDNKVKNSIRMLSVAATKFVDLVDHRNTIDCLFKKIQASNQKSIAVKENIQIANQSTSNQQQIRDSKLETDESIKLPEMTNSIIENNVNKSTEEANQPSRSKTDFQNLNCKKMMDEYFRELEADIVKPKEVSKPKLTIVNMFNKIAERTGQDIKNKKDDQSDNQTNQVITPTKLPRPNPIIDLINKNNQRLKKPVISITLDGDENSNQPSTSNQQEQAPISFAAKQLELIRQQGLLDESELKKLENEFLKNERSQRVEKVGFFRRKTLELQEKKRLKKTIS